MTGTRTATAAATGALVLVAALTGCSAGGSPSSSCPSPSPTSSTSPRGLSTGPGGVSRAEEVVPVEPHVEEPVEPAPHEGGEGNEPAPHPGTGSHPGNRGDGGSSSRPGTFSYWWYGLWHHGDHGEACR